MRKILFISNMSNQVGAFSKAAIFAAKKAGFKFQYASNWNDAKQGQIQLDEREYGIIIHNVDIARSPFSFRNYKAYKQIRDIVKEQKIEFIHCNTPVGGAIGRLLRYKVEKVIYEAHGFHFYKGAPKKNWILYYSIEKALASKTDVIITINKDDYEVACKRLHPKTKVYYVPGVGIELEKWNEYTDIREECGIEEKDFVVLTVGRLEKNKNHETILNAISQIEHQHVKLVICGDGVNREMLQNKAADMGLRNKVIFLGNRTDMTNIYHMADCFVMASYREGLSRAIMEAMACGLPCIVSDIRGNRDLIDSCGGFLFNPTDSKALANDIEELFLSNELRIKMKEHNQVKIQDFSFEKVVDCLTNIYKETYK